MKNLHYLIIHQFTQWQRNRLLYSFLAVFILLWGFCLLSGITYFKKVDYQRKEASLKSRQQWLSQDAKHPHIAAHFGNFAFKPINALSIFDNGIEAFSGTYVYMEAHRQNDMLFTPAQSNSSLMRLGELNIALLLQTIIPLFLFVLTFNSVLAEKLSGTLPFLKSSGASGLQILLAKVLAPLLLLVVTIFLMFLASIGVANFNGLFFTKSDILRLALIFPAYIFYYFIIICVGVITSTISKTLKQSLTILLCIWVLGYVIVPKLISNIGSQLYPLPSNTTFKTAVNNDIKNGIDGHNTKDLRAKKFTDAILKKYKVDSTSKLPLNIEGLLMMEGEKYSSKVFSQHFNTLGKTLTKQQAILKFASFFNPLLSLKMLSMGLSNTDLNNELRFKQQSEEYRMGFVQKMNQDMALHSKENEFYIYKVNKKIFKSIKEFNYRPYTIQETLNTYRLQISALMFLVLIASISVFVVAKRV